MIHTQRTVSAMSSPNGMGRTPCVDIENRCLPYAGKGTGNDNYYLAAHYCKLKLQPWHLPISEMRVSQPFSQQPLLSSHFRHRHSVFKLGSAVSVSHSQPVFYTVPDPASVLLKFVHHSLQVPKHPEHSSSSPSEGFNRLARADTKSDTEHARHWHSSRSPPLRETQIVVASS